MSLFKQLSDINEEGINLGNLLIERKKVHRKKTEVKKDIPYDMHHNSKKTGINVWKHDIITKSPECW